MNPHIIRNAIHKVQFLMRDCTLYPEAQTAFKAAIEELSKIQYQKLELEVEVPNKLKNHKIAPIQWEPTEQEVQALIVLDPLMRWDIPNIEFPRIMSNDDVTAMLATKCATNPSAFWRDRDSIEGWLIGEGIKITA